MLIIIALTEEEEKGRILNILLEFVGHVISARCADRSSTEVQ